MKGPDFPTGGILVEPRESIVEAYKTGRGAFRLRAKWEVEELPRGQYRIIVTEIPYQVQKGKLIERIAEIINAKKLPILEDVHDASRRSRPACAKTSKPSTPRWCSRGPSHR